MRFIIRSIPVLVFMAAIFTSAPFAYADSDCPPGYRLKSKTKRPPKEGGGYSIQCEPVNTKPLAKCREKDMPRCNEGFSPVCDKQGRWVCKVALPNEAPNLD